MIELENTQQSTAVPLFRQTQYGVLAAGTLVGGQPGRGFVQDPRIQAVGFVRAQAGWVPSMTATRMCVWGRYEDIQ